MGLKILFYGASVTAQSGESGYFQHLIEMLDSVELVRLPYSASHLQFAGIAMLQKVIDESPQICFLDWVTPSTPSFPDNTVRRVNKVLLSHGIFPVWLLFPRTDDLDSSRNCCLQVFEEVEGDAQVEKIVDYFPDLKNNIANYLRDVVHTNERGAKLYANWIKDVFQRVSHKFSLRQLTQLDNKEGQFIPKIVSQKGTISHQKDLMLKFTANSSGKLKFFVYCVIGPNSPMLRLKLNESGYSEGAEASKIVVDQWCYYEREMLVNMPEFDIQAGKEYSLSIEAAGNPFQNIATLKPLPNNIIEDQARYLKFTEIIFDADISLCEMF